MSNRFAEILVIVEGEKTDVRLMERVFKLYGINERHQIVSYKTNIYALYNSIFSDPDPDSLDLQLHLRSREPDPDKKAILDRSYVKCTPLSNTNFQIQVDCELLNSLSSPLRLSRAHFPLIA